MAALAGLVCNAPRLRDVLLLLGSARLPAPLLPEVRQALCAYLRGMQWAAAAAARADVEGLLWLAGVNEGLVNEDVVASVLHSKSFAAPLESMRWMPTPTKRVGNEFSSRSRSTSLGNRHGRRTLADAQREPRRRRRVAVEREGPERVDCGEVAVASRHRRFAARVAGEAQRRGVAQRRDVRRARRGEQRYHGQVADQAVEPRAAQHEEEDGRRQAGRDRGHGIAEAAPVQIRASQERARGPDGEDDDGEGCIELLGVDRAHAARE